MPVALLTLLFAAGGAHAFSDAERFDAPVVGDGGPGLAAGGAGRRFTGSIRDGFDCAVCHDGGAVAPLTVEGLPEDGYEPGRAYDISVSWPVGSQSTVAVEWVLADGSVAGEVALPSPAELEADERCGDGEPAAALFDATGGRRVVASDACGASRVRMRWTAPAGAGTVAFHAAAVTGDRSGDAAGDATVSAARLLPLAGNPPPEVTAATGGCATSGRAGGIGLLLALFLLLGARSRSRRRRWSGVAALALGLLPATARAVPGPDSTAILANSSIPESVALATTYATARQIPDRQLCAIPLGPERASMTLDEFRTMLLEPLSACLEDAGVLDRIEAVVLVRGVPIRVGVPDGGGVAPVSLAAALGVWRSEEEATGTPLLGLPPGRTVMCGGGVPCYAAFYQNPFRFGVFRAGYEMTLAGVVWRPLLVTMLNARTYEDAENLVVSALDAELDGPPVGEFLFMDGADPARGVLDVEYDRVIAALQARGFTDVSRVPFQTDLTGRTLVAFFTGTSSLGMTIEGNEFVPGALVDNLTSLGAVPENFDPSGTEAQVSISRWVEQGVAGVHGATAEPLNGVFPSRFLIVDYVDGSTLAEAYHRRLPNVYWQNLVLGDAMAAPFALRPRVTVTGITNSETVAGARAVTVTAEDPAGNGIASIALFVDGVEVARADGDRLDACVVPPIGDDRELLAVAQAAPDPTEARPFQPKGWREIRFDGAPGPTDCGTPADAALPLDAGPDAAQSDAGADAGPPGGGGGCGCHVAHGTDGLPLALLVLVALLRRFYF